MHEKCLCPKLKAPKALGTHVNVYKAIDKTITWQNDNSRFSAKGL